MPSHKSIDEITIKTAKLELELKKFFIDIKKKDDWLAWLGVFVSLCSTLLFTEFKSVIGVEPSKVRIIYGFFTFLSGIMLINSVITSVRIKGKDSLNYIMDVLLMNSITPYEFRLLYILKMGDNENAKILVFQDELYDCYMLPHCKNEALHSEEITKQKLAEYLGIPKELIKITYYDTRLDKISKKYSEYHRKDTIYYFSFCYVKIRNAPQKIMQSSFEVEGRKFEWMSCQMLNQDENTRKKNSDVIRHIDDNYSEFLCMKDSL